MDKHGLDLHRQGVSGATSQKVRMAWSALLRGTADADRARAVRVMVHY